MASNLERSLQRDIDLIRSRVIAMGKLAEEALATSLQALTENNRELAYSVVLRDRFIDEMEKELDQLCQRFLIRQQPVAGQLRFVYATIKINNELERIGDYAESIARQYLTLSSLDPIPTFTKIAEIANLAIPMLRNAIQAFINEDADMAKATMEMEKKVDDIRYNIDDELVHQRERNKIPLEALSPLMIIASRFERVADQACNICEEVLYMCTGQYMKHKGKEVFRLLFADEHDACRGQMAVGIGCSLGMDRFIFSSAGIAPEPVNQRTVQFMASKGIDISSQTSKYLNQILNLENYQVIVSLCKEAEIAFPQPPTKTVSISWNIEDPSRHQGSEAEIEAAFERCYRYLDTHIRDLVNAVMGSESQKEEAHD